MFIEVERVSQKDKSIINLNKVLMITPVEDGSTIIEMIDKTIRVKEKYSHIKSQLEKLELMLDERR